MQFWQSLAFTETDQLVPLARICEELGFQGVSLADHLFYPEKIRSRYPYSEDGRPPFDADTEWPDAWVAISAMAAATTCLHFDTGIFVAPLRHPIELAKAVSTASVLSEGRIALGLGAGWEREEFDVLDRPFRNRGRRLDEMIEVMRKLWTGEMVEHHGEHYEFDRLRMTPAPPARIPIHVGGTSKAALRRAARNDGWIGAGNDPSDVPEIVAALNAQRHELDREGEPFEIIVAVTVPPDLDLFHRLEDQGVTAIASFPMSFSLGQTSRVEQKRAVLERYAENIIARY